MLRATEKQKTTFDLIFEQTQFQYLFSDINFLFKNFFIAMMKLSEANAIVSFVKKHESFDDRRIKFSSIFFAYLDDHCDKFEVCDNASLSELFFSIDYTK